MKRYLDFYIPNCVVVYEENHTENGAVVSWAVIEKNTGRVIRECAQNSRETMRRFSPEELEEARKVVMTLDITTPFQNAYIRFGNLPESGYSKNYAIGKNELGISCYRAVWDLQSKAYCMFEQAVRVDVTIFKSLYVDAPILLITGTEVGEGGDGEPVLNNAKRLAQLQYNYEEKNYRVEQQHCSSIQDSKPSVCEDIVENHHADMLFNYCPERLSVSNSCMDTASLDLYHFLTKQLEGVKTIQDIKEKLAIYSKIPGSEYEIMEYCPDEVQFYSPILEIGPGTLPHVPHEVHFDFSAFLCCGIVHTLSCNIRFIAGQDIDALYSKGMLSKYVS
jgi:hypothetical protein